MLQSMLHKHFLQNYPLKRIFLECVAEISKRMTYNIICVQKNLNNNEKKSGQKAYKTAPHFLGRNINVDVWSGRRPSPPHPPDQCWTADVQTARFPPGLGTNDKHIFVWLNIDLGVGGIERSQWILFERKNWCVAYCVAKISLIPYSFSSKRSILLKKLTFFQTSCKIDVSVRPRSWSSLTAKKHVLFLWSLLIFFTKENNT